MVDRKILCAQINNKLINKNNENNICDKLIQLSKIFKEGFTIELKESYKINQYSNMNNRYIVSYLTIIEIKDNKPIFKNIQHIPSNCIIGGWADNYSYLIELNKAFKSKKLALKFAKSWNQKYIYDLLTHKCIKVK